LKDAGRNSEPLDAILRQAMSDVPGAATPECADAQALAAYWDKSLALRDRERLEAHLGDCTRCQMQLAAIARAEESARDATAKARVPWYRRWQLAVPAMAAAAAVLVFIAIRRPAKEESGTEVVAMAKREAPAAELNMPERAPAPAPSIAAAPAAPASNEIAMNQPQVEARERAESKAYVASRSLSEQAAVPNAAPMIAGGGAAAMVPGAASGGTAAAAQIAVTIPSPDHSGTWIVGKNGMVEWRDANGASHLQHSGVTTDLTAGIAVSASVCWIVGRSGTVIRTIDGGEHWLLITAPASENLVAVSASSGSDATITTASGQRFATTDGGASWRLQ
jgi:hypothetical protein